MQPVLEQPDSLERDERDTDRAVRSGPDPVARALLVAALALSLLRFLRLGEWSLWIDEAFTLADVAEPSRFANPLGYWVTGWVLELLGATDEAALRTTAAGFGALCVPLLIWAVRPAFGARAASLAGLLLATSSWHLYWSQSARFYTLAMAIGLIGGGLALRGMARRSAVLYAVGIAVGGLAAGAHPTGVFVLPGLLLVPLLPQRLRVLRHRGLRLTALAILLVGGLASIGWALKVAGSWGSIKGGGNPVHFVLTTGFYVGPLLAVAAVLGTARLLLERLRPERVAVLAVPVAALVLGLLVATQLRMTAQYVYVLLPWIAALAAYPVAEGAGASASLGFLRRNGAAVGYVALLVLPALANCFLYLGPRFGERPRWRDAYATVEARSEPGDLILGMAAPVGEYYLDPGRRDVRRLERVVYLDTFRSEVALDWDRYDRRTWFVVNHEEFEDWPAERRRSIERVLSEDCRLVESFPLIVESRDLSVHVYRRN